MEASEPWDGQLVPEARVVMGKDRGTRWSP